VLPPPPEGAEAPWEKDPAEEAGAETVLDQAGDWPDGEGPDREAELMPG
jgi:hypothetical protein